MGLLFSCAGTRPDGLGVRDGVLAPCPSRPNCVCSDDDSRAHGIEPLRLAQGPSAAWAALLDELAGLPGARIVESSEGYVHAECESRLLGFVDDLELQLRSDEGLVAVRSASRLGYSDLGVNRQRVETLRERLRARGAVE
jgi:uncharacterized protein (DUF1499 family)